jgi:hypothetical protein
MSLVIYCDGGLGNRLNSLRGGICLASKIGAQFIILWPINRMCESALEDIFDTKLKTLNIGVDQVLNNYNIKVAITHESSSFVGLPIIDPRNYLTLTSLLKNLKKYRIDEDGILYYNSQHPPYTWHHSSFDQKNILSFKRETIEAGEKFLITNSLRQNKYLALHLRGTDYGFPSIYFSFWRVLIGLTPLKTILCTDDFSVANKFIGLKNVFWKKAENLPCKMDEFSSWNKLTVDEYGREFNYNLFRSAASIKDALIELFLLSRGFRIYTSRSTFLYQAYLFDPSLKGNLPKLVEVSYHFIRAFKRRLLKLILGS